MLCSSRQAIATGGQAPAARVPFGGVSRLAARRRLSLARAADEPGKGIVTRSEAEEVTEKYGLEAGLFKVMTSKDEAGAAPGGLTRTQQAKQLLAQYGSAYLLTSVSFAIVSFTACYAAVSAGVDVAALLARVGLTVSDTSEKVGTFAIAYAAHKALSPVRFPPTVALTPVVAKWIGKKPAGEGEGSDSGAAGGDKQ